MQKCNYQFESFQWVDSRLQPTKEPCPECGEKAVKQGFFTAPAMTIDDNYRIDKPHNANGFQDVMERVCNGAGEGNKIREATPRQAYVLRSHMAGAKLERQENGFVNAVNRAVRSAGGPINIVFKNGARLSCQERRKFGGRTSSGSETVRCLP